MVSGVSGTGNQQIWLKLVCWDCFITFLSHFETVPIRKTCRLECRVAYLLAYKSLPRISRPPKNRVHMLSKIIDPCISRRYQYSKLTTCCTIVRILGGFYDAQLKCSIARRSLSLSHFRQMWMQLTRPIRPAIGSDITWHTGLLVAASRRRQPVCCTKWDRHLQWAITTFQDSQSKRSRRSASIDPGISRPQLFEAWFCR